MKKASIQLIILTLLLLHRAVVVAQDENAYITAAEHDSMEKQHMVLATSDVSQNDSGINNEKEVKDKSAEDATPEATGNDKNDNKKVEKKESETVKKEEQEKNDVKNEHMKKDDAGTKKPLFYDENSREYIALFAGYGGHFPVADYGTRYAATHLFSCTAGIYVLNLAGISPEFHFRYTKMKSDRTPVIYDSTMALVQFYPGLVYRHHFKLPWNTLTLYGRIWDGFSYIEYESANPYFIFMKERITEYVNIFGLSAGCYYDVWHGILVGADFSYSIVFTAGKPLQSVAVTLNVGYRIL